MFEAFSRNDCEVVRQFAVLSRRNTKWFVLEATEFKKIVKIMVWGNNNALNCGKRNSDSLLLPSIIKPFFGLDFVFVFLVKVLVFDESSASGPLPGLMTGSEW